MVSERNISQMEELKGQVYPESQNLRHVTSVAIFSGWMKKINSMNLTMTGTLMLQR